MTPRGEIYSFINFEQAAKFGHVGWGFQMEDGSYFYGSSDHLWKHDWWDLAAWVRYMHVPPEGDIDWWAEQGTKSDMLQTMKSGMSPQSGYHIRYHAFKQIELEAPLANRAFDAAQQLKMGGWSLAKHNCVHQVYLVLSNYSKHHNLPNPFEDPLNLIPKTWFARVDGREICL